jgi:hypothetical protein
MHDRGKRPACPPAVGSQAGPLDRSGIGPETTTLTIDPASLAPSVRRPRQRSHRDVWSIVDEDTDFRSLLGLGVAGSSRLISASWRDALF